MMARAAESFHGGNFDQTEVILTKVLEIQSKNFDDIKMKVTSIRAWLATT